MSYFNPDSEDAAIEQPTIALFAELGWETLNCFHENFGPLSLLGRETMAEVVLPNRLRAAIEKLNPGVSPNAIEIAIQELTKDRSTLSPARANQAVYQLLKNGVKVTYKGTDDDDQEETIETVTLIDWNEPDNNDFLLASQFWISGDYGKKRADLVGFVNGIPLVFIELKASHKNIETGLREEPLRLQGHHSAGLLVQRRRHPVQRLRSQDRQHDRRIGSISPSGRRSTTRANRASSAWRR